MNQAQIVVRLDEYFRVRSFDERDLWQRTLPPDDLAVYERYALPAFVEGPWNGLMLDSTPEIDLVYLTVFPDQAVLDTILALELERKAPGALIFAHHPADYDENGGFQGIPDAQMEEMREHRISYYCCHAPLDCHPETSTVIALARALKLRDWETFASAFGGSEGVVGRLGGISFNEFVARAAEVTELPYVPYDQVRFNAQPVERVAIIPGSGDDPAQLEEAWRLGCDTYLTGEWWLRGDYDFAERKRQRMAELIPRLPMNLVGTSHYASEMVVLRDQMIPWFRNAGIEAKFIRQPDPFR